MSVAVPLLLLQITRADVRDMLRPGALGLVLGVLLLAVGLLSAALYGRSRRREASLLWLGSLALLYGLRLLARSTAFRLLCFEAPDRAEHPAAVLAGMNETLCGWLGGQYVTAAYLFLDRRAGLMRYGAAGHPPMLRVGTRAPEVREVEQNGLALGWLDGGVG